MQSLEIRNAYGASIPTLQHDDRLVGDRLVATAEAAKILGVEKGTLVVLEVAAEICAPLRENWAQSQVSDFRLAGLHRSAGRSSSKA